MQLTKINFKLLFIIYLIIFIIGYFYREQYLTKYPFIHNLDVSKKDYNTTAEKLNNIAKQHNITIQEAHDFIVKYVGYNGIDSTKEINSALNYCIRNGTINEYYAKQYFDSLKIVNAIDYLLKVEKIYDNLKH